ncbi:hypothetical protein [Roseospirillum parvum]|uniref:Uncharacterized protein n=1 Tax=Roseospirillum parvum TaxID=83401 RepID=A0A1G8G174_9PROT|nr:hypothetical protein [Roseospirillum parvum]SDH87946.1 hypothetical protein SAMN05421742_1184 [Roseospirillum parvum]
MPITSSDITWLLSGGSANADPAASLGGEASATAAPASLLDLVTGSESAAGDIEYRCIYLENGHGSLTLEAAAVWVVRPGGVQTTISLGLDPAGIDGTAQVVADESTVPSGVSWSEPTEGAPLAVGDVPAGSVVPIWVRRTVPAGASVLDVDGATLHVAGDTAAGEPVE